MKKRCSKCGEKKPLLAFSRDKWRKDGRQWWCKDCRNRQQHEWYVANAQRQRVKLHASQKLRVYWRRMWVLTILGGRCVECGTTENLQIDHINEDGLQHREAFGMKSSGGRAGNTKQSQYYGSMLERGCEGLQVLCMRHNVTKSNKARNKCYRKK